MLTLTMEKAPDEEARRLIGEGLDAYNASKAGPDGSENLEDLWVIARDANGAVQGGVKSRTSYSWLFIDWLWVAPSRRGEGLGVRLLQHVEDAARDRDCVGAYLYTFSFQAPHFYQRQGYEEFGRIDGLPPGHRCIWLKKSL
jgi:GNAT superfamily N-acetyltransferase